MIMFLLRPMFQTTINCTRNTLLNYIPFINAYITQHSKFRTIENLFIQQDMYMPTVSLSQPILRLSGTFTVIVVSVANTISAFSLEIKKLKSGFPC